LFEFAVEHVDDDARAWLAEAGLDRELGGDFEHVIALADVRRALAQRFRELAAEPTGYLAREAGREDLHEPELAAIAGGDLRPIGARLAFELVG
jgi:hypothetical protein